MPRPKSERARKKVLDAALALIAERGIGGCSVDEVSKRSGVAKTTIYRHWESGAKLLFDTIGSAIEPVPTPNTGSLRGDLIELHSMFLPMMKDPAMIRLMLGVASRSIGDENFRALKAEFAAERHQPLVTCIELAQARGELPDDLDIDFAIDMIEGPFVSRMIMRGEAVPEDEIPLIVDTVLDGLRAGAREPSAPS